MTGVEQRVRELLAEVYEPEGVDIYMNSRNRHLGMKTPIQAIAEGLGDLVLDEVKYLTGAGW